LKYRAIGATTNNNGINTLSWKAIAPKRPASIERSEITINLPEILAGKVKNFYHIGGNYQSSLIEDRTINFSSLQSFLPGQDSRVKITFLGDNLLNLNSIEQTNSINTIKQPNSINKIDVVTIVFSMIKLTIISLIIDSIVRVIIRPPTKDDNSKRKQKKSRKKDTESCSSSCGSSCGNSCGSSCGSSSGGGD
jgi:hypothetical protein